jgi:hypothetical protein
MALTYLAEMEFACLYAMRNPKLARQCALAALNAARSMGRPDLAWNANNLLASI